jgi:hypothetical protein
MAIVYRKKDQGRTITVCDSLPVHTGASGDLSTDSSTGISYTWTDGAWISNSLPKALTVASQVAPLTPDFINYDIYILTAQAIGLIINDPALDPTIAKGFMFRITDNGTSYTISWSSNFVSFGDTLPTATTAGKTTYVSGITNPTTGKYDVISVKTEA